MKIVLILVLIFSCVFYSCKKEGEEGITKKMILHKGCIGYTFSKLGRDDTTFYCCNWTRVSQNKIGDTFDVRYTEIDESSCDQSLYLCWPAMRNPVYIHVISLN